MEKELVKTSVGDMWLFPNNMPAATGKGQDHWVTTICSGYFVSNRIRINDYENAEIEYTKTYLKEGMTVVDVGANVGLYSVLAANKIGDTGRIFAFEPAPEIFEILKANAELYPTITPYNFGLHNHKGEVYFKEKEVYEAALRVEKGDDILKDIDTVDFIKIDVDGAEVGVLEGMRDLIDRSPSVVIFIEYSPRHYDIAGFSSRRFFELVKELGFEYGDLRPGNSGVQLKNGEHHIFEEMAVRWKRDLILWKGVEPFLPGM